MLAVLFALLFTLAGQQCSRVDLKKFEQIDLLSSSASPYKLDRPSDHLLRHYIFLIDMSNSMISGPCPQDVLDGFLFTVTAPNYHFDPNKGFSTKDDHRLSGIDCVVDKSMPIDYANLITSNQFNPDIYSATVYKTFPGIDWEGNRFKLIEKWIKNLREQSTPESLAKTEIMLIPVSGGLAQENLNTQMKSKFSIDNPVTFINMLETTKIDSIVSWMKSEHERNFIKAQDLRDEYRYENVSMGTTAPAIFLKDLYSLLEKNMRNLNRSGDLPFVEYQLIFIGDGFITPSGSKVNPMENPITKALSLYPSCVSCIGDRKNCVASCASIVNKLEKAWGLPEANTMERLDFQLSLLEGLPGYFGAGSLKLSFFQLDQTRSKNSRPVDRINLFPEMKSLFKSRNAIFDAYFARRDPITNEITANDFSLVSGQTMDQSLQMTHLFLLNPNYRLDSQGIFRIDSDGDGLFDDEEIKLGTSPYKQRTNGYCLDSFMANPAYALRCKNMAETKSCNPNWDADGDGLNECEESLLGTNPFDFDTDNDGIPDLYEWIYGYNPLVADTGLDTNGDGYLNTVAFAMGAGPQIDIRKLPENSKVVYELNSKGKEQTRLSNGSVAWLDLYEVILRHIPVHTMGVVNAADQNLMFLSRDISGPIAQRKVEISYEHQITSYSQSPGTNTILGLARLVDRNHTEKAYWRVFKKEIPISDNIKNGLLDLSQFQEVPARDRTR